MTPILFVWVRRNLFGPDYLHVGCCRLCGALVPVEAADVHREFHKLP